MGMGIIRYILLAVPLIGSCLMFVAGISPQDAASNLAAWAKLLGIDNPPPIIQAQSTDVTVFYVGLFLLVLGLGVLLGTYIWNKYFGGFIPLKEAATDAYNNLRAQGNSGYVHHADVNYRTKEKKLNYFASEIGNYADIYGTPELGTTMELIKDKFHLTCDFKDSGNVLRYHSNDKNAYENCSVKRADLKKAIKVLSEWKI